MIFINEKLIYLHVPKTGGNSISKLLLPLSSDQMTTHRHQDGHNRFGLESELTVKKHAQLIQYQQTLGDRLSEYEIAIGIRNPLDRAVSRYFSPDKWAVKNEDGWSFQPSYWCIDRFEAMVTKMSRLHDFLSLDDHVRLPDHLIRFDNLAEDLSSLIQKKGLNIGASQIPHVNKSSATNELIEQAKADPRTRELVASRFAPDYQIMSDLGITYEI